MHHLEGLEKIMKKGFEGLSKILNDDF